MPKVKLDAAFCLAATCQQGKRKTDYWDTMTTGFLLECRTGGGKTYALRYIDGGGRQRQHKIGGFEDVSFAVAQKAAKRLRSEVVLGGNPAGRKEEAKAVPLYCEIAVQHLEQAKAFTPRSYSTTEMYYRRHIVPRWGKLRLTEIRPQDISRWLGEVGDTGLAPATVEKIRVIFSRSFELARQWKIPGAEMNPVRDVPRRRFNNKREKFLNGSQVQKLFNALDNSTSPQLKSIVQLLLLTGARKTELLTAQWQHVNMERRAWFIPTTKTDKPRYVPLSQAAVDVIEALPRWDGCPWLLPNPETRKPYKDIKHPFDKARREAGLSDLRIHDLRHSAASFMINAGVDLFAVGRILGHADHQSTMRYSHLANDTLMKAVEAGAAKMTANWDSNTKT